MLRKILVFGVIILFLGMIATPGIHAGIVKIEEKTVNHSVQQTVSWRHLPFIHITKDRQFEILKKLGFITGSGTQNDPYIIEDFNLWGNPLAQSISVLQNTGGTLLYISDTEKHVVIRNNYIHHSRAFSITISKADNVVIENNIIKHNLVGICIGDSNTTIRHNNLSYNRERAIYMYSNKPCRPVIEYNNIVSNGYRPRFWRMPFIDLKGNGIWCRSIVKPKIHHNNIVGNTNFGVNLGINEWNEYTINATYNWWKSADGPGGVGPGSGDNVTAGVEYRPCLTEPEATAGPQY